MCKGPAFFGTRRVVRFAFAGLAAALLAGCADSSRYLGDPLGNPFKSAAADPTPTGSLDMAPPAYRPMHTASIMSEPLAPPPGMPMRHVATYDAPAHMSPHLAPTYMAPSPEHTASIAAASGHGSWSTMGGMSIIAGTGDSAGILAERYNVPTETLLQVNGYSSAAQIRPGTRLVIPVYSTASAGSPKVATLLHKPHDHSARAKLLAKAEKHEHAHEMREAHEQDHEHEHEKMHWVKGPKPAKLAQVEPHQDEPHHEKTARNKKTASVNAPRSEKMAKIDTMNEPKPSRPIVEEKKVDVDPTPTASLPPADEKVTDSDTPEFRWPAHGRIIQGFKTGGNDGINIAVPEGTSVKAAESGVVAYAGSEIKGFGNLVLIRHPNGYVTAYANNGDISVHRGEQVKRGQTIAKSGQSGNVASPQLHFELRKGSTPVDPTRYLAGLQ